MMALTADDIEALAAGAAKSPAALFAAIHQVARRRLDAGLVTAMRHDEAASTVERIYSSNEQAYPVGGRKLKRDTGWSRKVLVEHRVLVNAGDDDIRESFDDHAIIFGLGLHSCVNVPLVSDGKCIGTLNVLNARAAWSDDEVAVARALGIAALAGVLMMKSLSRLPVHIESRECRAPRGSTASARPSARRDRPRRRRARAAPAACQAPDRAPSRRASPAPSRRPRRCACRQSPVAAPMPCARPTATTSRAMSSANARASGLARIGPMVERIEAVMLDMVTSVTNFSHSARRDVGR